MIPTNHFKEMCAGAHTSHITHHILLYYEYERRKEKKEKWVFCFSFLSVCVPSFRLLASYYVPYKRVESHRIENYMMLNSGVMVMERNIIIWFLQFTHVRKVDGLLCANILFICVRVRMFKRTMRLFECVLWSLLNVFWSFCHFFFLLPFFWMLCAVEYNFISLRM